MGFLSRDRSVKRRQLSNRVQVAKGFFFTAISLSLLCYLLSLNCTTNTLLKRAKRSILNPLDDSGNNITLVSINPTPEQLFLSKYVDQYRVYVLKYETNSKQRFTGTVVPQTRRILQLKSIPHKFLEGRCMREG